MLQKLKGSSEAHHAWHLTHTKKNNNQQTINISKPPFSPRAISDFQLHLW